MNLFESVFRLPHAPHNNGQKYYICARRDNGFIPAYRAYFFINGNKIKRVSVFRYEHSVIFGKRADEYEFGRKIRLDDVRDFYGYCK